ncbi:MAG: hypothetical protein J5653_09125 [Clostridiales bacterium]|nr:hypothetical protein [Clostridiales bacterium]
MNYPIITPPFEIKSFVLLTKKEAKQHFQWFMETKESRIRQLEDFIIQSGYSISLDKTPESLIGLWKWYEDQIEWVDKTEKEIADESASIPERLREVVPINTKKLSVQTLALGLDISVYWGETMIDNNSGVHWELKTSPKKLDGVNRPQLIFDAAHGLCTYPPTMIHVCTLKSSEEKNEKRLFDLFKKWSRIARGKPILN